MATSAGDAGCCTNHMVEWLMAQLAAKLSAQLSAQLLRRLTFAAFPRFPVQLA
jgi:hypothetical protein